jgi:hypothetical protein
MTARSMALWAASTLLAVVTVLLLARSESPAAVATVAVLAGLPVVVVAVLACGILPWERPDATARFSFASEFRRIGAVRVAAFAVATSANALVVSALQRSNHAVAETVVTALALLAVFGVNGLLVWRAGAPVAVSRARGAG